MFLSSGRRTQFCAACNYRKYFYYQTTSIIILSIRLVEQATTGDQRASIDWQIKLIARRLYNDVFTCSNQAHALLLSVCANALEWKYVRAYCSQSNVSGRFVGRMNWLLIKQIRNAITVDNSLLDCDFVRNRCEQF